MSHDNTTTTTAPPPLRVERATSDGTQVLLLIGDAGVANAERLDFELARHSAFHPRLAVLNLSGLTFISSLAMAALISFQRAVNRHGGKVRLAAVPERLATVLRRAHFHQVFEIHETVDAALATQPVGQ